MDRESPFLCIKCRQTMWQMEDCNFSICKACNLIHMVGIPKYGNREIKIRKVPESHPMLF
jgi:hypothetical protein